MAAPLVEIVHEELEEEIRQIERSTEGWMHDTYLVETRSGSYVIQLADATPAASDSLDRGLRWYRLLEESPVPVPRVVTDTVRTGNDRLYTIVERVPGTTAHLDIDPQRVRNAGRCFTRIHAFRTFTQPGFIEFVGRGPVVRGYDEGRYLEWLRSRVSAIRETLIDGGMRQAGEAVAEIEPLIAERLTNDFTPRLCHNDFSADNVLFENGEVSGIIDFDIAHAGHHHRDVVKGANGFWFHDPGADWPVHETFYEGYRSVADLGPAFVERERVYRVETMAHTIADMLDAGRLNQSEQSFYTDAIHRALERVVG